MKLEFRDQINWQRPWLTALGPVAASILRAEDWRLALNASAQLRSLRNHRGLPVQFVAQAELPTGTAYETYISDTGRVPTRDNLHDFFNGLMWLAFPRIKVQLNKLQAAEICRTSMATQMDGTAGMPRGKLRDAATIFDENAALLVTRDVMLIEAVREHRWSEVFLTRRSEFERDCDVHLFGHALMEKLVSPYKGITAHAWPVIAETSYFSMSLMQKMAWIDSEVARQLANGLVTADFMPLPVLGLPGWSEDQNRLFYDDATVFRPKRRACA